MDVMAVSCDHCGFAYPERMPPSRSELLTGRLADAVLFVAALISAAAVVVFVGIAGAAVYRMDPFALALAFAGAVGNLALVIVFLRNIQNES